MSQPKKRILIIGRKSLQEMRYESWFDNAMADVVLITSSEFLPNDESAMENMEQHLERLIVVSSLDQSGELEFLVIKEHKSRPFSAIIATQEFDLLRAAALRELLDIPGQSLESALCYRDKFLMKRKVKGEGIPVTPFALAKSACDIVTFYEENGPTIVIKPRDAAMSRGVVLCSESEQLVKLIRSDVGAERVISPRYMMEKFVRGRLYHVDGLRLEGRIEIIWASEYVGSLLPGASDGKIGSVFLDEGDPCLEKLTNCTRRVVDMLPSPDHMTFHAEFFVDEEENVIFNEIASRTGGLRINQAFFERFGVNLNKVVSLRNAGFEGVLDFERPKFQRSIGWLIVPQPRRGRVLSVPRGCDLPYVRELLIRARPGEVFSGRGETYSQYLASFILEGLDAPDVKAKFDQCGSWLKDNVRVDEQ